MTVAAGIACGGNLVGPEDMAGWWDVYQVNGQAVPGTVTVGWGNAVDGQITLEEFYFGFDSDGLCNQYYRVAGAGLAGGSCTYVVGENGDITIEKFTSPFMTGTTDGKNMTLRSGQDVYRLRKRT